MLAENDMQIALLFTWPGVQREKNKFKNSTKDWNEISMNAIRIELD